VSRRSRGEGNRTLGLLLWSTAAHVLVFVTLGLIPSPAEVLARHEMEFEVYQPPEPKPEPEPEPVPDEPEPEPEPEPAKPVPKQAAPEPEPEPPSDEPPPSDDTAEPADFTGETLVAEGGGGGWTTAVGNGAALRGPVGKIGSAKAAGSGDKPAPVVRKGPRVVAAKDLETRPSPPAGMDGLLEQHYPRRARMQGVEGRVQLTVRVLPDGRLGKMTTLSETPGGWEFADQCKQMLRSAGAWTPPRAPGGTPVAVDIKYTCRFEVSY
jgi:TonB family protein